MENTLAALARNIWDKRIYPQLGITKPALDYALKKKVLVTDGLFPHVAVNHADTTFEWTKGDRELAVNKDDVHKYAVWSFWGKGWAPIVLDHDTMSHIKGNSNSIANIVNAQMNAAKLTFQKNMAAQLYLTAASYSDRYQGFADALITTGTFAGIDRSVDAWWVPGVYDTTTTLAGDFMKSLEDAQTTLIDNDGNPNVIFSTGAVFNAARDQLAGREIQIVTQKAPGDGGTYITGARAIIVCGMPLWHDPSCPSGTAVMLTDEDWEFQVWADDDFRIKGPVEPANWDGRVSGIIHRGQLVFKKLKSHARWTALV